MRALRFAFNPISLWSLPPLSPAAIHFDSFYEGLGYSNVLLAPKEVGSTPVPVPAAAAAPKKATDMTDQQVHDLFQQWNDALATLNPDAVAERYTKNSILLPTVSDTPRVDYEGIKSYLVDFLKKQPQGTLIKSKVLKGDDWALDAGIYEFSMGATGDKVRARYTYLYNAEDGEWKIAHHHSSIMPEAVLG